MSQPPGCSDSDWARALETTGGVEKYAVDLINSEIFRRSCEGPASERTDEMPSRQKDETPERKDGTPDREGHGVADRPSEAMSAPDGRSDSDLACAHVAPGGEAQSAVDSEKTGVLSERLLEEGPEPTVEAPGREGEGVADGPVSHTDPPTSGQEQGDEVGHQQPAHIHQPTELAGKASISKSNAEATNGPSASLPSAISSATGLFESSVGVHQASANGHGPSSAMGRTETEPERNETSDLAALYRHHVHTPEKDSLVIHLSNETYTAIAVLSPQQKQNFTIGRSHTNDVVVGALSVSGKHAEFKVEADMSVVARCFGRNSTWVQSGGAVRRKLCQNVWSRPLLEKDILTLGDVKFVITFGINACMQNLNELTTAITLKGQIIWEAFKMPRGKGVENRSVRVGPGWVAVHVGKGKHDEALASQYRRALPDLSSDDSLKGFVAGLVWISRTIRESDLRNELSCSCNGAGHEESCPMNPFITGPFCSIVKVIVPLSTPIRADGQMNEWRLPQDVSGSILAQLSEND